VSAVARAIVEPGFLDSATVQLALGLSAAVALVASVTGVFTVIRGQSFAGHSLADLTATGGSAAFLVGVGALWGFIAMSITGAGAMQAVGIERRRGRDLATGIVLGAGLGLAALFLYLVGTTTSMTGATNLVLFGSMFVIAPATLPAVIAFGIAALALVAAIYRPLLLSSISPELAAARGVPVRRIGALYMLALAAAVGLSSYAIGAILSTALLIAPAAAALRLTRRPAHAIALACTIAVASCWLGVLLAYDSYYWPPHRHGWPVSFFIVALLFLAYLAAHALGARRRVRG
jgi:zinc/manganese transport system permease protein